MKHINIEELIELMNSLDFIKAEPFNPNKRVIIDNIPTSTEIENSEKQLKISLPRSYIEFNKKSPWYWFSCACNYIINPINHSRNFFYGTISEINKLVREKEFYKYCDENEEYQYYKEKIPDFLIVFDCSSSIDGDYICFDTRFPNEFPIVNWQIGNVLYKEYSIGMDKTDIKKINHPYFIYPNFSTYMYYKIKDSLEYEKLWG